MKKYVGVKEIAEYTGLAVGTVYYYMHKGKIPFYKFNGKPRFVLDDVDKEIKKHSRGMPTKKSAIIETGRVEPSEKVKKSL